MDQVLGFSRLVVEQLKKALCTADMHAAANPKTLSSNMTDATKLEHSDL